jgi:hypothetical protein
MRYNERVRWLGFLLLMAACGQDESFFQAPNPGNLEKAPYDFSAAKYPRDLSAVVIIDDDMGSDDLGIPQDLSLFKPDLLAVEEHPDLRMQ